MDCRIYRPRPTLFVEISSSNVAWFTSMLLSFGIVLETTLLNLNGHIQSTASINFYETVFQFLVLLTIFLLSSSLYWSTSQRPKRHLRGLPRMNDTLLCDLPEYTLSELACHNGSIEGGKIYVALNGKIFDVSKDRKQYSPGGSYKMLAGRDASRAFATLSFEADSLRSDYDDLSDVNDIQRNNLYEWESIFSQKYSIVGRVVSVHSPKSLQDLSMKAIFKTILRCQTNCQRDCIDSLPLPSRLKRILRNYFYEHM